MRRTVLATRGRAPERSPQPLGVLDARELLNRAVQDLHDLCAVHREAAGSVRQLVGALSFRVAGVPVDGRSGQTGAWETGDCKPEVLQLSHTRSVICEEIAPEAAALCRHGEAGPEEAREQPDHGGI